MKVAPRRATGTPDGLSLGIGTTPESGITLGTIPPSCRAAGQFPTTAARLHHKNEGLPLWIGNHVPGPGQIAATGYIMTFGKMASAGSEARSAPAPCPRKPNHNLSDRRCHDIQFRPSLSLVADSPMPAVHARHGGLDSPTPAHSCPDLLSFAPAGVGDSRHSAWLDVADPATPNRQAPRTRVVPNRGPGRPVAQHEHARRQSDGKPPANSGAASESRNDGAETAFLGFPFWAGWM